MILNKITIKKVSNGFLIKVDYERLIGKNQIDKYVFGSFEKAIVLLKSLLDSENSQKK